jgi:hypothetical protein
MVAALVTRHKPAVVVATLVVAVIAVGLAVWFHFHTSQPTGTGLKIVLFAGFGGEESGPLFSPDGNAIAFAWGGEQDDNQESTSSWLRWDTAPAHDQREASENQSMAVVPTKALIIPARGLFIVLLVESSDEFVEDGAHRMVIEAGYFMDPSAFVTGFGPKLMSGDRNFSMSVPSASALESRGIWLRNSKLLRISWTFGENPSKYASKSAVSACWVTGR